MSMGWINFFADKGPLVAGVFAVAAALVGIISTYASQEQTKQANARFLNATRIIERVIGKEWPPLTSAQISDLKNQLIAFNKPARVQIMYEWDFGMSLAQSISLAFEAAGWTVTMVDYGSGFGSGIELGPGGGAGKQIQAALSNVMRSDKVRLKYPDKDWHGLYFVGVGANSN